MVGGYAGADGGPPLLFCRSVELTVMLSPCLSAHFCKGLLNQVAIDRNQPKPGDEQYADKYDQARWRRPADGRRQRMHDRLIEGLHPIGSSAGKPCLRTTPNRSLQRRVSRTTGNAGKRHFDSPRGPA
jgi:hypothetical protein